MKHKQTYACCHKGNYYEPRVAPDKTLAHAPGCRAVGVGEYVACSGTCNGFILNDGMTFDGPMVLGYCDNCNPFRMVELKVPAVVVDIVAMLRDKWFVGGKKRKGKR